MRVFFDFYGSTEPARAEPFLRRTVFVPNLTRQIGRAETNYSEYLIPNPKMLNVEHCTVPPIWVRVA